ncbi:LPS export ABC transporter periplasmic protein LptC [Brevundimonas pishanensis]|uniref:LPS export ABC transporter periplasmic protein LptC n=1 Tax=Brevundimonas pishanensis TaxID=2896315 RepID=UPI001FA6F411|nr:LPS export ABC transporter periplasmic protein LptC [Brevundimonas pishanensis]
MSEPEVTEAQQEALKSADEARVAKAAAQFRKRSQRVQRLRRVLPIIILLIAGSAVTWVVFRSVMSGVERRANESRELRLDNPMFHGQDAQGRSFRIGAEGAIRSAETNQYRLVKPLLELNLGGQKITKLTADGGTYNEGERKVIIGPNVSISDGGSGFVLKTDEAVIDTSTGIVTGNKGVHGTGPLGTINASAYAIHDQGRRVEFKGQGDQKISGTINPSGSSR